MMLQYLLILSARRGNDYLIRRDNERALDGSRALEHALNGLLEGVHICVLAAKNVLRYSELRREDEIPPRVEYALSEKGKPVVPILQSICAWSGAFFKADPTQ